jgi:hypothetical protein
MVSKPRAQVSYETLHGQLTAWLLGRYEERHCMEDNLHAIRVCVAPQMPITL